MNLVFDFGAVLFQWQPVELIRQWFPEEAAPGEQASRLRHAVFGHADWHCFDRGTLGMDEVIARTSVRLNLDADRLGSLMQHIGVHLVPIAGTVRLLLDLHEQRCIQGGLKLYFLSNMPAPYARRLEELHAFLTCFDGGVFSGDVHYIKPEPEIYQLLQKRYALEPGRTVFIDDLHSNVLAAEQQGWTGIQFHSAEQLQAELLARNIYKVSQ